MPAVDDMRGLCAASSMMRVACVKSKRGQVRTSQIAQPSFLAAASTSSFIDMAI